MRLVKLAAVAAAALLPLGVVAAPAGAQIVSALLQPVVGAWVRSKVDKVDNLQVQLGGGDRELLGGTIPQAQVSGDNLLYEGLKISRVELDGENIRLNVSDVLQKGQSLRLLEPTPIGVRMELTEADLNESLKAPLIQKQLAAARVKLPIGNGEPVAFRVSNPQVKLQEGQLLLDANVATPNGQTVPVKLSSGLLPQNGRQLVLVDPNWLTATGESIPVAGLNNLALDLGDDIAVDELELKTGMATYRGQLTVQP
jgi:hypothetical protein